MNELRRCINLDLACADVCKATGNVLLRQTEASWDVQHAQLRACAQACTSCAKECERHADVHEHCRASAEFCRECADVCEHLIAQQPVQQVI